MIDYMEDIGALSSYEVMFFLWVLLFMFCFLAICAIVYYMARLLAKSNIFGDEDTLGIRKGGSYSKTAGSSLGEDLSVGSGNCIKDFRAQDVTRR